MISIIFSNDVLALNLGKKNEKESVKVAICDFNNKDAAQKLKAGCTQTKEQECENLCQNIAAPGNSSVRHILENGARERGCPKCTTTLSSQQAAEKASRCESVCTSLAGFEKAGKQAPSAFKSEFFNLKCDKCPEVQIPPEIVAEKEAKCADLCTSLAGFEKAGASVPGAFKREFSNMRCGKCPEVKIPQEVIAEKARKCAGLCTSISGFEKQGRTVPSAFKSDFLNSGCGTCPK